MTDGTAGGISLGQDAEHSVSPIRPLRDVHVSLNDRTVVARGLVCNTGSRHGAGAVQNYAEVPDTSAPKRLVGFVRVDVPAGAEAGFDIVVGFDRLATRDGGARLWRPPSGDYRICVGRCAEDDSGETFIVHLS
jgi:hypothetical protein